MIQHIESYDPSKWKILNFFFLKLSLFCNLKSNLLFQILCFVTLSLCHLLTIQCTWFCQIPTFPILLLMIQYTEYDPSKSTFLKLSLPVILNPISYFKSYSSSLFLYLLIIQCTWICQIPIFPILLLTMTIHISNFILHHLLTIQWCQRFCNKNEKSFKQLLCNPQLACSCIASIFINVEG